MSLLVTEVVSDVQKIYPNITSADIITYLNDERPELLRRLKLRQTTGNVNLTAETQEYTAPTALVNADAVEYVRSASDGDFKVLIATSTDQLDVERPNWRTLSSGEPSFFYFTRGTAGLLVGLDPKPDQTTTSGYPILRFRYTAINALASGDTIYDDIPGRKLYSTHVARRIAEDRGLKDVELRIGLAERAYQEAEAYVRDQATRQRGTQFVPSSMANRTPVV